MKVSQFVFKIFLIGFLILAIIEKWNLAEAAEADYFTNRNFNVDALAQLNGKTNQILRETAAEMKSCSENELIEQLIAKLGGSLWTAIEKWADALPGSIQTDPSRSIYRDTALGMAMLRRCCTATFRIKNTIVSGDKLGHFVQNGYEAYLIVRARVKSPLSSVTAEASWLSNWKGDPQVESIMKNCVAKETGISGGDLVLACMPEAEELVTDFSSSTENGLLGLTMNGVKSYADMAANVEGFRFWANLTSGKNPYFTCKSGRWELRRELHWGDVISDAWDEAVNCNEYIPRLEAKIVKRIQEIATEKKYDLKSCPLFPDRCSKAAETLGSKLSGHLLHPKCLAETTNRSSKPNSKTEGTVK